MLTFLSCPRFSLPALSYAFSVVSDVDVCDTENTCAAFAFDGGVVGGDTDGCTDGIRLTTRADKSCTLKCKAGYTNNSDTSADVTCSDNADEGGDVTTNFECIGMFAAPFSSLCAVAYLHFCCPQFPWSPLALMWWCIVLENSCAPYVFGTGVVPGIEDGCTENITLTSSTNPTCSVQCGAGYTGDATIVSCASNALRGAKATSTISCIGEWHTLLMATPTNAELSSWSSHLLCSENTCAPFVFGTGVVGGDDDNLEPCSNGIALSTVSNSECSVKCESGYEGEHATVYCAQDALQGTPAISTISCVGEQHSLLPFAQSPHF